MVCLASLRATMDVTVEAAAALLAPYYWMIALLVFLSLVVWYGTAPFSMFKKLGVPGPAPWPFVGNLPDFAKKGKNQELYVDKELMETYGRVCGVYQGRWPTFLITDVDLLKQILVKEFPKFPNREAFLSQTLGILGKGVVRTRDAEWKRIRNNVTPTFSAFKMKQVLPLMRESCETLARKVGEIADSGKSVEMWRTYGRLTMEVILTSAFGVQADTQNNPDEEYTKHAEACFKVSPTSLSLAILFPALAPLVNLVTETIGSIFQTSEASRAAVFLSNTTQKIIDLRRQAGRSQRKDLLQSMLEANVVDANGNKVGKLNDSEVIDQSITFMLAGYETTSNALAFATYCLAVNPDKQEKLLREIDEKLGDGEMPDYDTVQNLEYLDMVISESLRLYSPGFRFGRTCSEACTINGIHFPKGVLVTCPVFALHHDPEYWPDPEKFEPERFTPEQKQKRNPYCYMPFGAGPRNCIGMRFALLEAKMALICILQKFKFERAFDTQVPLKLKNSITMAPADGIHVKIVSRQ